MFRHFLRGFLRLLLFLTLSAVAISYALGYTVNWQAKSIQQTGMIALDTDIADLKAAVYCNGEQVAEELPYRIHHLFPGRYTVEVRREGYQVWSREVVVEANRVQNFSHVVLIYTTPKPLDLDSEVIEKALSKSKLSQEQIQVIENELWVDGRFVTRYSKDIVSANWWVDREHLVLQVGNELLLTEQDGQHTSVLYASDSNDPIRYAWQNPDGRVLVYADGERTGALELFEKGSFLF